MSDGPRLVVRSPERVARARVRAVAWDFDDTLVRLPVEWQRVMAEFFADCHDLAGAARTARVAELTAMVRGWSGTPLTEMARRLAAHAERSGLTPLPAAEYRAGFDAHWRAVADSLHTPEHVVGGVVELLAALRAAGLDSFLVTGGDRDHKLGLLDGLGLAEHFPPARVFGDPPDGAPFTKRDALDAIRASVAPDLPREVPAVAFVADGHSDLHAARAAACLAVGFNRDVDETDVLVVGDAFPVAELTDLLRPGVRAGAAS